MKLTSIITVAVASLTALVDAAGPSCRQRDLQTVRLHMKQTKPFCQYYLSAYRTRSPLKQFTAAKLTKLCKCIVPKFQRKNAKPGAPLGNKKAVCKPANLRLVKRQYRNPAAFCKFYTAVKRATVRGLSPVPGLVNDLAIRQACACYEVKTTKTTTKTTMKPKTTTPHTTSRTPTTTPAISVTTPKSSVSTTSSTNPAVSSTEESDDSSSPTSLTSDGVPIEVATTTSMSSAIVTTFEPVTTTTSITTAETSTSTTIITTPADSPPTPFKIQSFPVNDPSSDGYFYCEIGPGGRVVSLSSLTISSSFTLVGSPGAQNLIYSEGPQDFILLIDTSSGSSPVRMKFVDTSAYPENLVAVCRETPVGPFSTKIDCSDVSGTAYRALMGPDGYMYLQDATAQIPPGYMEYSTYKYTT